MEEYSLSIPTRPSLLILGHSGDKSVLASAAASPQSTRLSPNLSRASWEGSWDETQPFDVTPNEMGSIDAELQIQYMSLQ